MEFVNQNILLVSNEPWSEIWFSKHHLAVALSKNNKVFFINSPENWKLIYLFTNKILEKKVSPNLTVLSYQNYFPLTGKSDVLFKLNHWLVSKLLNRFLKKNKIKDKVFITFDPVRLINPKTLRPKVSIYYCVDNHIHVEREKVLVQNIDYVFTVAPLLVNKLSKFGKPVHLISHGIQEPELSKEEIINHKTKKEILFMGSLNYRLNYFLLRKIALELPGYTFKLIGRLDTTLFTPEDTNNFNQCKNTPNIHFLGALPFTSLTPHILDADLCLCFSKQDYISNVLNSLKILQYLSYGKTVVSNYFEVYKDTEKDIIYMYDDEQFVSVFKSALDKKNDVDLKLKRIEYTSQFTYPKILRTIEQTINQSLNS